MALVVIVSLLVGLASFGVTPKKGTRGRRVAPFTKRAVFIGVSNWCNVKVKGCDGDTFSCEVIASLLAGLSRAGATLKGTRCSSSYKKSSFSWVF